MQHDVEEAPSASDGLARSTILESFNLSGLTDDPRLTAITNFAASLCEVPIALVSIVESERQWFPARTGLDARETSRDASFCAHAMLGDAIMLVPDARLDPRFSSNPLVLGEPNICFYAGAPLRTEEGVPLGALCVIDTKPRAGLTPVQEKGLLVLAQTIMTLLTLRRSTDRSGRERDEQEARFRILADTMPQMVWSTRPDGFHDYYNARWYEYTGVPEGSTDGEGWNGMFHPEDQDRAWSVWRHSLETGDPYEIEYRLRDAKGQYRWTLGRALPIRDDRGAITRWFGTCTDIHDQKMLQAQREVIAHELSHRIKNIFAVIGGLITFSSRHHPEMQTLAIDLRDRIIALGRAHDFVRPHSDASRPEKNQSSLHGMIEELLAPYRERIRIEGEDLPIDDRSATPLALLFHELATNAAKYGALSAHDGAVVISSRPDGEAAFLSWAERGGPAVEPPQQEGFGTKLMELSVARQMGGRIERAWATEGLVVNLTIPSTSMYRIDQRAIRAE
ncbi:PAS domain-containing protein [Sphingomonas oryzagri]|uniref:histidine kinase n=1 Tax=Sphingomonas oryzagri TaxID=3042314 RepID=A0ABT6N268_9SPHN|nr:PAS domain-containing protein [Sphingomonas oryzagri]MDH7639385.1 PAS domain-containing protein [Sphingomonas oryzagri]